MNRLLGHSLILLGAGAAACAASLAIERPERAPDGVAVVVRKPVAPAAGERGNPGENAPIPQNREALVRLLERELTRVGCYGGPIGAAWGREPQTAMRAFLAHANARLPVTQPDETLLRLLQSERTRVCAEPCDGAPGHAAGPCLTEVRDGARLLALGGPAPIAIKGAAAAAPEIGPSDPGATHQDAAPTRAAHGGGTQVESESAHEPTTQAHRAPFRHSAKSASARPPKIVRVLIRNLQRFAPLP